MPSDPRGIWQFGASPKRWPRRLDRLTTPAQDPIDALVPSTVWTRLTVAERQELSLLHARVQRVGLGGLPVAEMDRYLNWLVHMEKAACDA